MGMGLSMREIDLLSPHLLLLLISGGLLHLLLLQNNNNLNYTSNFPILKRSSANRD